MLKKFVNCGYYRNFLNNFTFYEIYILLNSLNFPVSLTKNFCRAIKRKVLSNYLTVHKDILSEVITVKLFD